MELNSCQSVGVLRENLFEKVEKIVYRENGSRAVKGSTFLKRLEKILPLVGITRVADISDLSVNDYPVFQAIRPNVHGHWRVGQNSGAQGKGPSDTQAKISAIMESIESFCAEPKNTQLIRGSFSELKNQRRIFRPNMYQLRKVLAPPSDEEPLMWAEALHFESQESVLVPAESVYFPFFPQDYGTRSFFSGASNGLASGATYLEAVNHAIYEVIERFYESCLEKPEMHLQVRAFYEKEYFRIGEINEKLQDGWDLEIFALTLPNTSNVPVILCVLIHDNGQFCTGWGCQFDVDTAIERAISEAFQTLATWYSGSREDMPDPKVAKNSLSVKMFPQKRSLRIKDFKKESKPKAPKTMRAELEALVTWLEMNGFNNLCIANLTRSGIDIPVVKVIVPGLPYGSHLRRSPNLKTTYNSNKFKYSF